MLYLTMDSNVSVAKVRQAQMLIDLNKVNEAHDILKQCLVSHPGNLNLRALYAHFLMQNVRINDYKTFREFVFNTLKDHDKYDVYSLCAAAWLHYFQARESRETSPKAIEDRKKNFQKSAELYDKALQIDPHCAYAAQGLAIITAEDALGTMYGALPGPAGDEAQKRNQNIREALDIFAKVRESIHDGCVYVNMGHCYYARDEFDRAIESVSCRLHCIWFDFDISLVRDSIAKILPWSECWLADVSLPIMVFKGYQGPVAGSHDFSVEICRTGALSNNLRRNAYSDPGSRTTSNRATKLRCITLQ